MGPLRVPLGAIDEGHHGPHDVGLFVALQKETRGRSRVVGIFPSVDSHLRRVPAYQTEYADDR